MYETKRIDLASYKYAEKLCGNIRRLLIASCKTAKENSLYLYKNPKTQKFEIYALIGGKIERLDDNEGAGSIPQDQIATDGEVEEMLNEVFPQTL